MRIFDESMNEIKSDEDVKNDFLFRRDVCFVLIEKDEECDYICRSLGLEKGLNMWSAEHQRYIPKDKSLLPI